ncbi:MAG: glycogen debranching enzyme family protein, partial [Pyrinomonadaceae bacterium]|nr:glycogen debranching enzyme family protein [Pyrinomonadaceae bacterium]
VDFDFSANDFPGKIHPEGFKFLTNFKIAPFPTWTFEVEGVTIEKTVMMIYGENSTIVNYKFHIPNAETKVQFRLKPLLAFRDYHHLQHETVDLNNEFQIEEKFVSTQPLAEMPRLFLNFENAKVEKTGFWHKNFVYYLEKERGFDFHEDLFQPFALTFDANESNEISIIASTEVRAVSNSKSYFQAEIERRAKIVEISGFDNKLLQNLALSADKFIVKRENNRSIIAGYHWFSDWGRDAMIALPGLTLTTKRFDVARSILLEFSNHISQGMLPNRFPDAGETPEYNTVDATLWFFEAVRAYVEATKDYDFVEKKLYEKLVEIIIWHLRGTRYNIHVDTDGLLFAGEENSQLTWMDATSNGKSVTPRIGKAVEIQALWYNALRVTEHFAEKFYDSSGQYQYNSIANLAELSFNQKFWNEESECLFDCINAGQTDKSIRPNQIFAVSLKNSMLSAEKARKVVQKVEKELLTPFGLRSLSPHDENYCGVYEGDAAKRDAAYHQGTVWAWLSGAYLTAYAKSFADETDTKAKMEAWLKTFKTHFATAGIEEISEIFDGDAPHKARGCIAQAWSVGEILRVEGLR